MLAPINQVVNATTGINIATSDPAASTRITPAPAGDGTLAEGTIVVNSSDSPLSDSQWDTPNGTTSECRTMAPST